MSEGRLVILSGPSGVGKDTVINAWRDADPRVTRVVAYTTRAPRHGEVNGIDYHFVPVETFLAMAEAGKFLEWMEVHGNFYGTPLASVDQMIRDGLVAILKIDVQGALRAIELRPEALTVFLLPPSDEELEARIRRRALDDEATIQKRLLNARKELEAAPKYQHCIVNDDLAKVVERLLELVPPPRS
jgi:guanylate kinase